MGKTTRWRDWLFLSILACFMPACGTGAGHEACEDSPASTGDQGRPPMAELRIPAAGQNEYAAGVLLDELLVAEDGSKTIAGSSPLTLALGADYPEVLDVSLTGFWDVMCGPLMGPFAIAEVISSDALLVAELVDDGTNGQRIALRPQGPGDVPVTIRGTQVIDDPGSCAERYDVDEVVDFELTFFVQARQPAGAAFTTPSLCGDASTRYVQSGARWSGFAVHALDDSGEPMYPANASAARPVAVTVSAPAELALSGQLDGEPDGEPDGESNGESNGEPDGGPDDLGLSLDGVVVTGPSVTVYVRSDFGDELALELIEAGRIDSMDVWFPLLGAGGGGIDLQDGGSYGETGFARTTDRIGPHISNLYVDGDPICTHALPALYTLTTSTPEVCPVEDPSPASSLSVDRVGPSYIEATAIVQAPGVCRLHVSAPTLDDCSGLSESLAVTFVSVDGLISGALATETWPGSSDPG